MRSICGSAIGFFTACCLLPTAYSPRASAEQRFDRIVIDANFAGGYQVEVVDVNGDRKPDIVAVGGGTCAWYENPAWTKRIITTPKQTPGVISSATADLDGDGKAEVAIAYDFAMNEPTKGKLLLASQNDRKGEAWTTTTVVDVGSIHRLRWGSFGEARHPALVVAPIFGRGSEAPRYDLHDAQALVLRPGSNPKALPWQIETVGQVPVLHAILVRDVDGDGRAEVLCAGNDGVVLCERGPERQGDWRWKSRLLAPGAAGEAPKRGSSEVHVGRLADGRRLLATIDPWHGNQVAVRIGPVGGALTFTERTVIDDSLDDGHALWVADVDGDGDDEVFAGHRGKDQRVSIYDFDGKTWMRTVIDRDVAAQDLRGGDVDGDGVPDVIAIGGRTHNVVWYRPRRK
jgi:hypothetical protein